MYPQKLQALNWNLLHNMYLSDWLYYVSVTNDVKTFWVYKKTYSSLAVCTCKFVIQCTSAKTLMSSATIDQKWLNWMDLVWVCFQFTIFFNCFSDSQMCLA